MFVYLVFKCINPSCRKDLVNLCAILEEIWVFLSQCLWDFRLFGNRASTVQTWRTRTFVTLKQPKPHTWVRIAFSIKLLLKWGDACQPYSISLQVFTLISAAESLWWLITDSILKHQDRSKSLDFFNNPHLSITPHSPLPSAPSPYPKLLTPVRSWASRSGWEWRAREVRP